MERIAAAARNNAHLYQRVCSAHGCRTELAESFLICLDRPPRFFGQAVTLSPNAYAGLEPRLNGAFKDSFFDAEPDQSRHKVLFEAEWIWSQPVLGALLNFEWKAVETDKELMEWERAWAEGDEEARQHPRQFPPSLLSHDDLAFYAASLEGRLLGGAILNFSGSVVGISNVFVHSERQDELWRDLPSLCGKVFPNLPAAGYERGSSLESAKKAGFEAVAPLRVWSLQE